jgi:predicted acylesterase/phospholipase RssA
LGAGKPTLFRSYRAPINKTFDCTIWEAARATSAAPTFFKSIVIGEPGATQPYIDGGIGLNNPTLQVIDEAQSIFSDRRVACIVSIGTGQAKTIEIPKPGPFQQVVPLDFVNAVISIATECEMTSEAMVQRFQNTQNFYFRFNVEQGLQEVKMAQWDRLDKVAAHTKRYLQMEDVKKKIGAAVDAILQRPEHVTTAQIGTVVDQF